ncbi:MAG: hypothetical protein MUO41_13560 [Methyloceanibacter sp.]|jgi:hypothetical protein|nr:hypothetical protein [Methyloceanibacter sp.]
MNLSPFATDLILAGILTLLVSFLALEIYFSGRQLPLDPIIQASAKKLRQGWYQATITMINRSPHGLLAVSLRRVKPRSARLMAPISSVSTNEGDFQVWSDPSNDKRSKSIPLDIAIGSRERSGGGAVADVRIIVWIFLPDKAEPAELVLELTLSDAEEKLRRYRLVARRES